MSKLECHIYYNNNFKTNHLSLILITDWMVLKTAYVEFNKIKHINRCLQFLSL